MSIRDTINENVDWAWWIASWADRLLSTDYPGYNPPGTERADMYALGDYSYAHVATKYLSQDCEALSDGQRNAMLNMLKDLVNTARRYSVGYEIPREFWPTMEDSTLRLLEYRPGAVIEEHTDFNLFTVNLYRTSRAPYRHGDDRAEAHIDNVHIGEIWEQIDAERTATPHWTDVHPHTQYSVVFFAMPSLKAMLPSGVTVGEWLKDRKAQSRSEA